MRGGARRGALRALDLWLPSTIASEQWPVTPSNGRALQLGLLDFFAARLRIVHNPKPAFQAKNAMHNPTLLGGALIGVLSLSATLQGQGTPAAGDPPAASRRWGPLSLAPTLPVSVGWDSNVFNQ